MINSGKLYGSVQRAVMTVEASEREARQRHLREHVSDFLKATIPGLEECINAVEGPNSGHVPAAIEALGKITRVFRRFADDEWLSPRTDLADELDRAYDSFRNAYRSLGEDMNRTDSFAGFLELHLGREVRKVVAFLRDEATATAAGY